MDRQLLDQRIEQLIAALVNNYRTHQNPNWTANNLSYTVTAGKRYIKIMMHTSGSASVHAFVDTKSGALLKAASFKAPAKGPRYWLLEDESFARCIANADWAGGYLYLN